MEGRPSSMVAERDVRALDDVVQQRPRVLRQPIVSCSGETDRKVEERRAIRAPRAEQLRMRRELPARIVDAPVPHCLEDVEERLAVFTSRQRTQMVGKRLPRVEAVLARL